MGRRVLPLLIACLLAAGVGGYLYLQRPAGPGPGGAAKPPGAGGRPVPVRVHEVTRRTVAVRLPAVGRAQAPATVTVRSRIDGQLLEVAFQEGQWVKRGDLLFRVDPRPLEAALREAEANLARDQAQLDRARVQLRRNEQLAPKGHVSQEALEDARATAVALEASVRADAAAVERARLELGYATLRAPLSGLAGSLLAHPGDLIKTNDTALVVIHQVDPIEVAFALPERHLGALRRRLGEGPVTVTADPQDEAPPAEGRVSFLNHEVDASTGAISLRARFANPERRLLPGQFLNLEVLLSQLREALVVPARAVQMGQKGPQVYLVGSDGKAELRPVTPGPTVDGDTVIEQGLILGERVVTDGQVRLGAGSPLEIQAPGGG